MSERMMPPSALNISPPKMKSLLTVTVSGDHVNKQAEIFKSVYRYNAYLNPTLKNIR